MPPVELRRAPLASGATLEYVERGRGPTIVFLHGYSDSWVSFHEVLVRLPDDVRGVALTQRGHGNSERPPGGYRIEDFAGDAVAFMDATGITSAVLVGHSMGSLVAQEVALTRPDRLSRLVLVGSATDYDNPVVHELAAAIHALDDPVPREFARDFQAGTVYRPIPEDFLDGVVNESLKAPARVWRDAMAGILAFRSAGRLTSVTIPTLIVWGDRDEIAPRPEQDRLHGAIAGSRLEVYVDTGHAPHWEQPDRFVDDLIAFVKS